MEIADYFVVGRQEPGDDERRCLGLDDPVVSRAHLHIRLDSRHDEAFVTDTSVNGTILNGVRMERGATMRLLPGDRLLVGSVALEFKSDRYQATEGGLAATQPVVSRPLLVLVVGDIVNYSTISEYTDDTLLLESLDCLYSKLREILLARKGTLEAYIGDAFFAIWDCERNPEAVGCALHFTLDAVNRVAELAPDLALRDPEGRPIRMGWGVTKGWAATSTLTGTRFAVLGDVANVAFRVSGLAGRNGRPEVLATESVRDGAGEDFVCGSPERVRLKGRVAQENVFGVSRPA